MADFRAPRRDVPRHGAPRPQVDFLLRRGGELLALDVTYAERPRRKALAGLRAIGGLDGVARRVLVYRGNEDRITRNGIEVWPLRRFLDALESGRLWPARSGKPAINLCRHRPSR